MTKQPTSQQQLRAENEDLRARLDEAEDTLRAIRSGEVDSLVVSGVGGEQLFTLKGTDRTYRILIEDMGEGALTLTAEGVILYANRCFAEMVKMPLEKVIGATIHPWIAPGSQPIFQALLSSGVSERRREELDLVASDGTRMPVYVSVGRQINEGMPDVFCVVATDLTEQKQREAMVASERSARESLAAANKSRRELLSLIEDKNQAQAALAESEEKYRKLAENLNELIYRADPKTLTATYVNHAVEYFYGYTVGEFLGNPALWEQSLHPDDRERVLHFILDRQAKGEAGKIEYRILHRDGTIRWVIDSFIWVKTPSGEIVSLNGVMSDITERKQTEEALRVSALKNQLMFESSRDALMTLAPPSWKFTGANQATLKLFGASSVAEFTALGSWDISPQLQPDGRPSSEKAQETIATAMREGSNFFEWEHQRLDGRTFATDVLLTRMNLGEEMFMQANVRDITERKEHETRIINLNRALRILSTCNGVLIHAQTEEELFQDVCRQVVEIGAYQLAWVAYPGEGLDSTLISFVHFGDEAIHRLHAELALTPEHASHCLTVAALRTRQTQLCDNLHERPECDFDPLRDVGVEAILALPLLQNDDVYGVLTIFSSMPDIFRADEVKLMEELAADLAYGIVTLRTRTQRNQALEGELKQTSMLRQALEQTIVAIALTLEKRDPYTTGHQQRVAEISAAIATEMGLSPQQVEGIHFGSLIHDIGKIAVPAEILSKPAKLSNLEYMMIQTHPLVGFDIVKDIPFPWPVAQIVHQHHERLDGSGYPQGLKGDEIMLEARILAVADVLEAMSAHRPYRAALGMEAATKELERGRGTIFDAAVVDACLRLVKEKKFTFAGG